jgi:hypothetical protein
MNGVYKRCEIFTLNFEDDANANEKLDAHTSHFSQCLLNVIVPVKEVIVIDFNIARR